jgi:tripartite-type tricarboxylate transporter receptor subunit TctC
MSFAHCLAAGTLLALTALPGLAAYPDKPIRLVTPFPAGGVGDAVARLVAEPLSRSLGQPVIVDAKPGADGQIAASDVRRAAPDGYTLLVAEATTMSMVPAVRKAPPYDPLLDFTAIGHVTSIGFFLVVHPSVPAQTLAQFVAYARANPDALAFASPAAPPLLQTLHLMRHAKIQLLKVYYRGEPSAMPDLVTGRVQVMVASPFLIAQPVKEGKLRVLAAMLPTRSEPFPQVPTLGELGYPEAPQVSWAGLFGPAKLPADVVARLSRELAAVLAQPALRGELEKRGAIPRSSTPGELREIVRSQLDVWRAAVNDGSIPRE